MSLTNIGRILSLMAVLGACRSDDPAEISEGILVFTFSITKANGHTPNDIKEVSLEVRNGLNESFSQRLTVDHSGGTFTTEGLELPFGTYSLEKFSVLNEQQEILYMTPLIDAELAQWVQIPLSMPFSFTSETDNEVHVEVLPTAGTAPEEFGYSSDEFKPFFMRSIPVSAAGLETPEVALSCTLRVEGIDTLRPDEMWAGEFDLQGGDEVKIPVGYDQYKITASASGFIPQAKFFRRDYAYDDLMTKESLSFELIPENTEKVIVLEQNGYRYLISTDPCRLWARLELPEAEVFEVKYIRYFTVGMDEAGNYLSSPFPGPGLIDPPLLFANYNNLFDDSNFHDAPSYCEEYLNEAYRDRLDEVTFEKIMLLDFDYSGNESAPADYDVYFIYRY